MYVRMCVTVTLFTFEYGRVNKASYTLTQTTHSSHFRGLFFAYIKIVSMCEGSKNQLIRPPTSKNNQTNCTLRERDWAYSDDSDDKNERKSDKKGKANKNRYYFKPKRRWKEVGFYMDSTTNKHRYTQTHSQRHINIHKYTYIYLYVCNEMVKIILSNPVVWQWFKIEDI